ncbi:MAG: 4-alpha-glucanotransferase [Deltaproteobacteria bacterium]|jgi:4-alpha-glucanotransferase|nr:4-alpha-glucanotransferase [Deltaproteobacteria bacterium]
MTRFAEGWRAAGLMMHATALPGPYGIGDFGAEAHRLAEVLKKAGLTFWQMLPVVPASPALGNSPYSAVSAFAGHELLISPDLLVRDGWLTETEAAGFQIPQSSQADFEAVIRSKKALLDLIFSREAGRLEDNEAFQAFGRTNAAWLNDYAFYAAAKEDQGGRPWTEWPGEIKHREDWALARDGSRLARPILRQKLGQFFFYRQLSELKEAFNRQGLALIGDTAFYLNLDSSDVWSKPDLFELDNSGRPLQVAGVPPDYFSQDGQLWGSPVYRWPSHQNSGFAWWKHRLSHSLAYFDWTRLDHFRAMAGFWSVPAGSETAASGHWVPSPGWELFRDLAEGGPLNIIAEDLGVITPDVTLLRQTFQMPGMRVLQFGFGPDQPLSLHTPFRIEPDNFVYAGTHDNNTARGWFRQDLSALGRRQLAELAGGPVTEENAAWHLTRLAWLSPGACALTNLPDLLNLDEKSRFNTPGTAWGNWGWRAERFPEDRVLERLGELTALAGRDNMAHPNILTYG